MAVNRGTTGTSEYASPATAIKGVLVSEALVVLIIYVCLNYRDMKGAEKANFFFQKTVSGTKSYTVAKRFPAQIAALKGGSDHKSPAAEMPSRAALRKHPFHLHLPPLALPDQLDIAATNYLREHSLYSVKHLRQLSTRLVNYLHERELFSEV